VNVTLILALASLVTLLLVAYALLPTFRPAAARSAAQVERLELEEERDNLYAGIRRLEEERASGVLDEEDYRRLRLRDETRAALIIGRLDALPPVPSATVVARPAWPLAAALLVVVGLGGAAAYQYAVPQLQLVGLPKEEAETLRNARLIGPLEKKLNLEVSAVGQASIETLMEFGDAAWHAQDYERAFSAYQTVVKRQPDNAEALSRFGQVLFFVGRNEEAIEILRAAVRLDNKLYEAHMTIGNLLFGEKDAKGAIAAWEQYQLVAPEGGTDRVADLIASARTQIGAVDPGAKLYAANCAGCHGSQAQGMVGPNLISSASARDRAFVERQVTSGGKDMPAFPQLSEADVSRLVDYVTRLKKE
jgi:cytochrome c-type biogenesis protein CcmH